MIFFLQSMIEDDGIDPNEVYWGTYIPHRNPLNHSIALKDIDFTRYLLIHGARPHYKDLRIGGISLMHESVCKNDMLRNLFLQYKIMFYRHDCGTIVPEWENIPAQDLKICLLNLINAFKNKKGEITFIITVAPSMAQPGTIEAIKNAGFKVSHSDNEKIQLLFFI